MRSYWLRVWLFCRTYPAHRSGLLFDGRTASKTNSTTGRFLRRLSNYFFARLTRPLLTCTIANKKNETEQNKNFPSFFPFFCCANNRDHFGRVGKQNTVNIERALLAFLVGSRAGTVLSGTACGLTSGPKLKPELRAELQLFSSRTVWGNAVLGKLWTKSKW